MKPETRTCSDIRSIDASARTVTGYASTGSVDRHGTIIEPAAFKKTMRGFMKNPVVLAAHVHWYESSEPPVIARVIDWSIDDVGLLVTIKFAQTRIADEYWQLYMAGFMRAFSVGFRPVASEMRPREDGSGDFEIFTEVELLEISCVAAPSNRESLVTKDDADSDHRDACQIEMLERSMTTAMLDDSTRRMMLESTSSTRQVQRATTETMDCLSKTIAQVVDDMTSIERRVAELERDRDFRLAGPNRLTEQIDTDVDSCESIAGIF